MSDQHDFLNNDSLHFHAKVPPLKILLVGEYLEITRQRVTIAMCMVEKISEKLINDGKFIKHSRVNNWPKMKNLA